MCPTALVPCAWGGQGMVWAFPPEKAAADASQVCVRAVGSWGTLQSDRGDRSLPLCVGCQAVCPDQPDGSVLEKSMTAQEQEGRTQPWLLDLLAKSLLVRKGPVTSY